MPAHDPIALGLSLPLWSVLPFAGLLLAIALFPLVSPSIWVRHYGKVCLAFGLPVAGYFLVRAPRELLHTVLEYVSFLVLLASLFTISGGILLRGTLRAAAGVNCGILAVGAVLANLFGTTGASMLLIRPLLRANAHRKRKAHVVVFFIFVVANIGGALTPIGDPPLFLGYLRGVPFFWTLRAMGLLWGVACALVIGIFYLVDRRAPALSAGASGGPRAGGGAGGGGGGGRAGSPVDRGEGQPAAAGGGDRGRLPAHSLPGDGDGGGRGRIRVEDPGEGAGRERVHLAPDRGGGDPVRGDLRHDDPRAAPPQGARRGAGGGLARPVFLGHGGAVDLPRQRADLPHLLQPGAGGGGDANGGGRVGPAPAGDQRGRGLHGGEFVHRQRPQFHGEGDRGGGRDPDALLPRLHGLVLRHPPPHLRPPHPRILLTPEPGQPQNRDVPRTPPKVGHSRTSFPPIIGTDSPVCGDVCPRSGGVLGTSRFWGLVPRSSHILLS